MFLFKRDTCFGTKQLVDGHPVCDEQTNTRIHVHKNAHEYKVLSRGECVNDTNYVWKFESVKIVVISVVTSVYLSYTFSPGKGREERKIPSRRESRRIRGSRR